MARVELGKYGSQPDEVRKASAHLPVVRGRYDLEQHELLPQPKEAALNSYRTRSNN